MSDTNHSSIYEMLKINILSEAAELDSLNRGILLQNNQSKTDDEFLKTISTPIVSIFVEKIDNNTYQSRVQAEPLLTLLVPILSILVWVIQPERYLVDIVGLLSIVFFIVFSLSGNLTEWTLGSDFAKASKIHKTQISFWILWPTAGIASGLVQYHSHLRPLNYLLAATVVVLVLYQIYIQNFDKSEETEHYRIKYASLWLVPFGAVMSSLLILSSRPISVFWVSLITLSSIFWIVTWAVIAQDAKRSISQVDINPIRSTHYQRTIVIGQISLIAISSAAGAIVLYDFAWAVGVISADFGFSPLGMVNFEPAFGDSRLLSTAVFAIVLLPVLPLAIIWVHGLYQMVYNRVWIYIRSEPISSNDLGFNTTYQVRVADLGKPAAITMATWWNLSSVVIFDKQLVSEIDTEQLAAIYYHEEYHAMNHHSYILDIIRICGPIGGIATASQSFYPAQFESDADAYAVDHTSKDAVVSALHDLRRLNDVRINESSTKSRSTLVDHILKTYINVYHLLYHDLLERSTHRYYFDRIHDITK